MFAVSPDGKSIAYADTDLRQLNIRSLAAQDERRIPGTGWFRNAVFSPDSAFLATVESEGTVRVWDLKSFTPQAVMHDGGHVEFSPDGRLLATGGVNGIKIWDTESQIEQPQWKCEARVDIVRFSPDGRLLAASCSDRRIRVYDVETGRQVASIDFGEALALYCLCFSPDSNLLASGGTARVVNFGIPAISRLHVRSRATSEVSRDLLSRRTEAYWHRQALITQLLCGT